MSNLIGLVAASGSGKSTSLFPNESIGIKGLNPKETLYINVAGKPLPVRGANKLYPPDIHPKDGGNYLETSDIEVIRKALQFVNTQRTDIKNVVIEDMGYLMGFDVMKRAKEKGFEKWSELAAAMFSVINEARTMRRDINVICIFHQEKGEDGNLKMKTSGKLIDNTIYLDGLFTFIFYAVVEKDFKTGKVEYKFRTKSDGQSTCKTPVGCFTEEYIPNDMGYVIDTINDYYNG
jgi:hypothetical protein